jgi:uncharacterized protein (DUF1697 family)
MTSGNRHVALLRGINVGRNKRISMAQLRELLAELGYTDVTTYLQSGNAVVTSPQAATDVAGTIENGIAQSLGMTVKVVVRSGEELAATVAADPLGKVATDPAKYLVGFMSDTPAAHLARGLDGQEFAPDLFGLAGRELYLWCPNGVRDSPLSRIDWDRRLGVTVTMRNWNTVTKLLDLALG